MDTFLLLKYLLQLAMPPASLAAGLLVGAVLVLAGWRRLGRLVATFAVAQTVLLSLHPISDALLVRLRMSSLRMRVTSSLATFAAKSGRSYSKPTVKVLLYLRSTRHVCVCE